MGCRLITEEGGADKAIIEGKFLIQDSNSEGGSEKKRKREEAITCCSPDRRTRRGKGLQGDKGLREGENL